MQDLSLHVLDVAENGVTAGATLIVIEVIEHIKADLLTIIIEDNGKGMEPEFLAKVLDPFVTTRTTRKVGLGLSLLQQAAQEADGNINVESVPCCGTKITAFMKRSHIDRKPMGDMAETVITLINGNPDVDFVYKHTIEDRRYMFDTRELRPALDEISMNHPEVIRLIRENIISGLSEIA